MDKKTNVKRYENLNKHIDFKREGKKSSARKIPTPVKCFICKKLFILPFKPRNPEVYCDDCFKKR
ncbi:MAG: hypothetical protein WC758_03690 [Candidatus Woesearchaeota archaeon]|jgi:hypothetical protein